MFSLIFASAARSAAGIYLVTRFFPSNLILGWLRSRRGLKFGIPAMLLIYPYFQAGKWIESLIQAGTLPGVFHLVSAACAISMAKFLAMGPLSVVLLLKAWGKEALNRRRIAREARCSEAVEAVRGEATPGKEKHDEYCTP